jgi:flavin reductase (DIM6/NTAB) family NADH-FMN oxidoreductase RutF
MGVDPTVAAPDEGVAQDFDELMAQIATALVVVTVAVDGEASGCLVGFHTQCSINPRRYALWLSKANHTYELAPRAHTLAVHFLDEGDERLAELFGGLTGDEVDKFERTRWSPGPGGVPLLDDCRHRLVLARHALFDAGEDHVCLVGDPIAASVAGEFTPLRLPDVVDIEPGHEADEERHDG